MDLLGRLSNSPHAGDRPTTVPPDAATASASDVDDIGDAYVSGSSIDELARSYGVNRTTIMKHLDKQGVPRRRVVRKMTDALVAEAAVRYRNGNSLATVSNEFNIAIRTLRREFRKAGVAIRPRRGWTY